MSKGSIEVSTYCPPVPVSPSSVSTNDRSARWHLCTSPTTVSLVAATVSIALHAVMITSMIVGGGVYRTRDTALESAAGPMGVAAIEVALQWTSVEDVSSPESSNGSNTTADPVPSHAPPAVTTPALPSEILAKHASVSAGRGHKGAIAPRKADQQQRASLYISQIKTQIDRAWVRPRTPLDGSSFSCRVRIGQDASGNVREVTVEICSADASWQRSLVRAIQSASPLPLPSESDVFAPVIRMWFESETYSPTAPAEQFESSIAGSSDQALAIQGNSGT